jgi:hypothetical protein
MGKRHQSNHDENRRPTDTPRTYDPIQAHWSQTRKFNTGWLKNGERLTVLQWSGYTLMSLLFVAIVARRDRNSQWRRKENGAAADVACICCGSSS